MTSLSDWQLQRDIDSRIALTLCCAAHCFRGLASEFRPQLLGCLDRRGLLRHALARWCATLSHLLDSFLLAEELASVGHTPRSSVPNQWSQRTGTTHSVPPATPFLEADSELTEVSFFLLVDFEFDLVGPLPVVAFPVDLAFALLIIFVSTLTILDMRS